MKLIVALGNPGNQYLFTRHNAGFIAIDYIAKEAREEFKLEQKFKCELLKLNYNSQNLILIKPQTYMNLSGDSLIKVMNFYKISIKDIIVIYDDISLNLGKIRFRESGTSGGHNGIKSIINVLGGDNKFHRLKIGIGPQTKPSEQYVLESFSDQELLLLKDVCKTVKNALEYYLDFGIQKAQNKYN